MTKLAFAVRRKEPVLVGPATATPLETKLLSDIDDQELFRCTQVPMVFFYRNGVQASDDRDPVAVIRQALGETLVPYYPLAGRLREVEARKLVVDCTGEGVLFVEADADVRLAELEAGGLRPPFPCIDQLLFDIPGSSDLLNRPLLLIQVTRLLCGGFVFALRFKHAICDGVGIAQFLSAVSELARGLPASAVLPAWSRELLQARNPPKAPAFPHPEYDVVPTPPQPWSGDGDMVTRTFTFGMSEIAAIKTRLLPQLQDTTTTFEALTAALWRARTAAVLEIPPEEQVRLMIVYNVRGVRELGLPTGYYGNAVVASTVLTTAGELLARPLGDTVEQIREAKAAVTAEYVRSTIDLLVLRGRPSLMMSNEAFHVSNIRHIGFHRMDFGWGEPVYGGGADALPGVSFVNTVKIGGGENVVAFSIVLPPLAMDRFALEVEMMLTPLPVAQSSAPACQARL